MILSIEPDSPVKRPPFRPLQHEDISPLHDIFLFPQMFTTMNSWSMTEALSMIRLPVRHGVSVLVHSRDRDSVLHIV